MLQKASFYRRELFEGLLEGEPKRAAIALLHVLELDLSISSGKLEQITLHSWSSSAEQL